MNRPSRKPLWLWIFVVLGMGILGGIGMIISRKPATYWFGDSKIFNAFELGFWLVAGYCFLAVALGKLGRSLVYGSRYRQTADTKINDENSSKNPIHSHRFQFTLFRLLLATAIIALVFGLSRMYYGAMDSGYRLYSGIATVYYSFSAVIAVALGGIVLFVKPSDFSRIAMTLLLGGFGVILGWSLQPWLTIPSTRREDPQDHLYFVIPAVLVCWFIGCLLSRWDERNRNNKTDAGVDRNSEKNTSDIDSPL